MKKEMYYNLLKYCIVFVVLIGFASCENDDDLLVSNGQETESIAEILSATSTASTLLGELKKTGLDQTLQNSTTYTLFAPQNFAFEGIDLSGVSDTDLTNLLLNHVWQTSTADLTANLVTGYRNSMAIGPNNNNLSVFVNKENARLLNGNVALVAGMADLGATNGVVHMVDNIVKLPTVADHVRANPEYASFHAALEKTGLVDSLAIEDKVYTVFAPNNTSFDVLIGQLNDAFGWSTLDAIPTEVLIDVLEYHVVTGANLQALEADGEILNTDLEGSTLSIDGTAIDDASYTNATINMINIQGTNGIVHGVDKVLLPNTVFQSVLDVTLDLPARLRDKGYTAFADAVDLAGMSDFVMDEDLTAFVPTNSAFDVFFLTIDNFEDLSDFDTPEELIALRTLLEYHLVNGIVMSNQLQSGTQATVNMEEIEISVEDDITITPSRSNAPIANVGITNIGARNGVIHDLNNVLVPESLAMTLGYPEPIGPGGTPLYGFELYDDALAEGMWNGGWANQDPLNTNPVKSGIYSYRVEYAGDGFEGWQVGGANIPDVNTYSFFNFSAYSENGTTLGVVLNEQWGSQFNVEVAAGEWTQIAIPVSAIANGTSAFNQVVIRGTLGLPGEVVFLDEIGFDVTYESVAGPPELAFALYKDELAEGMWNGGWATQDGTNTDPVREGIYSYAATFAGDGFEGWQVGGAAITDVNQYDFFLASIYSENGTTLGVVLNEQWDSTYNIEVAAGTWVDVKIPVSELANGTTAFNQVVIRGTLGLPGEVVYIDNVGFD